MYTTQPTHTCTGARMLEPLVLQDVRKRPTWESLGAEQSGDQGWVEVAKHRVHLQPVCLFVAMCVCM